MRKTVLSALVLLCLAGCKMHDDYTGEPFIHLEYTMNGEHCVYEDWGRTERSFLGSYYAPISGGDGLNYWEPADNQGYILFTLNNKHLSFQLMDNQPYFVDGRRYQFKPADESGSFPCSIYKPVEIRIDEGWFSFTRYTTEPYCRYDIHFECRGVKDDQSYEVTEGIIQVGRRFQHNDVKGLIKKEEEL